MLKNRPSLNNPTRAGSRPQKGSGPIWPGDSDAVKKVIEDLQQRGYRVDRHSEFHIKIGPVSFWLSGKGKIMVDPCDVQKEKGFDALLDVLEMHATRRRDGMRSITLYP